MSLRALRPTRRFAISLLVALFVLSLDTVTKEFARDGLALGERREVIPNLLTLTHIQNTGAAYGLLTGHRWLLVLTATLTAVLTPLLLRALPIGSRWAWAGPILTGMILGGAAGNLIERAAVGYVTDFLQVPLVPLFQVFNVSDASISVAIATLLILSLFAGDDQRNEKHRPAAGEARTEPDAQTSSAPVGGSGADNV